MQPDGWQPDSNSFFDNFTKAIDVSCKIDVPKSTSIRNATNNTWITYAAIHSIEEKKRFYEEWKDSCSKLFPSGDEFKYKKFFDYKRCLTHIIKSIRTKYYNSKISEASRNLKKHGK